MAISLLARHGWSVAKLRERLVKRGTEEAVADLAIADLVRVGLMGDRAFAEETARLELSRRPASDAFLEHRVGRVRDAGIDMAATLHVEQGCRLLGIPEDEGCGQVDGLGAGAVLAVRYLAGMQGKGVELVAHGWLRFAARMVGERPPGGKCGWAT